MIQDAILLGALNLFLLIVLLIILKKYLSLKPAPKEEHFESSKLERIKQVIENPEEPSEPHAQEISETKALIRGMVIAGKTDQEIITELKRRGISNKDITELMGGKQ